MNMQKKLKGHHNIIKFIAAASSGNEQMSHGMTEFLILTELCSGNLTSFCQDFAMKTKLKKPEMQGMG